MKIRYSPLAARDIESIGSFIENRNPSGALKVLTAIYRAVNLIRNFPLSARATERPNIRVMMVAGYPYKIFYKVHTDLIEIVHIRHAARRPWIGESETS
jgi:toxin ParE1/3/4